MAKIMIGLSGGVDSAVAAYLLKKQGHEVIAAFMRNWDSTTNNDILGNNWKGDICPQEMDYLDAKKAAEILDIPLYRVDFIKEYWDYVFTYFLDEYKKGRTPNPDIMCNKYIKFDCFIDFAKKHQVDYIATGHYAKVVHENGHSKLYKAKDKNKDQSYFLSFLSDEQLNFSLFPLENMTKDEVRKIANEIHLNVANKKDSTGICFIGERNFKEFLKNYIPAKHGDIIDIVTHKKVGEHQGVYYYTFGQRKGLNIGGIKGTDGKSWFVVKKDVQKNRLYVAMGDDNDYLLCDEVHIEQANFFIPFLDDQWLDCCAKFRYRQQDIPVKIKKMGNETIIVQSDVPLKAITPGQIAVFYDKNTEQVIASGIIDTCYKNKMKLDLI